MLKIFIIELRCNFHFSVCVVSKPWHDHPKRLKRKWRGKHNYGAKISKPSNPLSSSIPYINNTVNTNPNTHKSISVSILQWLHQQKLSLKEEPTLPNQLAKNPLPLTTSFAKNAAPAIPQRSFFYVTNATKDFISFALDLSSLLFPKALGFAPLALTAPSTNLSVCQSLHSFSFY